MCQGGFRVDLESYGDNFIPVIPVDYEEHTESKPFCWNDLCPCYEDEQATAQVNQYVQDGLMTPSEATNFVKGKGI